MEKNKIVYVFLSRLDLGICFDVLEINQNGNLKIENDSVKFVNWDESVNIENFKLDNDNNSFITLISKDRESFCNLLNNVLNNVKNSISDLILESIVDERVLKGLLNTDSVSIDNEISSDVVIKQVPVEFQNLEPNNQSDINLYPGVPVIEPVSNPVPVEIQGLEPSVQMDNLGNNLFPSAPVIEPVSNPAPVEIQGLEPSVQMDNLGNNLFPSTPVIEPVSNPAPVEIKNSQPISDQVVNSVSEPEDDFIFDMFDENN